MIADCDAALEDFVARAREASAAVATLVDFLPALRELSGPRVTQLGATLDEMNAAMKGLTRAARRYGATLQNHLGLTDQQLENLDADDKP